MAFLDFKAQTLKFHPTIFPRVMAIFGVTHVLSPYPQNGVALPLAGRAGHAYYIGCRTPPGFVSSRQPAPWPTRTKD